MIQPPRHLRPPQHQRILLQKLDILPHRLLLVRELQKLHPVCRFGDGVFEGLGGGEGGGGDVFAAGVAGAGT